MRKPPNERLTSQARTPAQAGGQSKNQARTPAQAGGHQEQEAGPRQFILSAAAGGVEGPGNGNGDESCSPAQAGPQPEPETGRRPSPRHSHTPERRCILTGAHGARDHLIRLALSPDGEILPDVRAKAPGRGAWIGVDRAALEKAGGNGKLKGALARGFKTGAFRLPDDLGERIEAALRRTTLERLGLEARAGTLVTGSERIEDAARKGQVHLLLHAEDAGEDGNRKLDQAMRVGARDDDDPPVSAETGPQGLVIPAQRTILSLALGRQNVVHIALIDRAAAVRVGQALDRWRAFIGPKAGLDAATAGTSDASAG
jgi:predicted RNA-binding protein YlxR (DUF448 family)